jgi:3'-phosphoadenosine 5'-phosphosulfate sulfotransferase (PAPS reductase)/FAD synthetase
MANRIHIPDAVRSGDVRCVVSASGGKDSTATILALREADVPACHVFADTGWEAPETYAYLDTLRARLGIAIDVVGVEGGMVEKIHKRAGFPARMQRWCTRELKLKPLRAYHDEIEADGGAQTACVVGVRAEESKRRAQFCEWEDDDTWGGWMWRPILTWPVSEVLAIHHRHGVPVNPLYLRGHNRVGCYPCIFASKEEIRLVAEHTPSRIAEIAALETECAEERVRRNTDTPGRYSHAQASYFQSRHGSAPMSIGEVVAWSRTDHGGRQLPLLAEPPDGGCFRWGLCEAPDDEVPHG